MKNLKIKKLLALAIAGVLSVGLVACGSSDADGAKTDAAAGSDSASGTYRTLEDIKKDGTINIERFYRNLEHRHLGRLSFRCMG